MPFFTKHVGKNAYTWNGVKKVPSGKVWLKTWNHQINTKGNVGGNTADVGIENWITPSANVPMDTTHGWYGYNIAQNGKIFFSKNRGSRTNPGGLMYDPSSGVSGDAETIISLGHGATFDAGNSDHAGTILPDGRIFFVDEGTSNTIQIINPETLEVTNQSISGSFRGSKAVRHPNGKIYGVAYQAYNLYEMDPETFEGRSIYSLGTTSTTSVVVGATGKLYVIPLTGYGHIYDLETGTGVTFGEPTDDSTFPSNRHYKGFLAPNGSIYCPASGGSVILKIDTYTDEMSYISGNVSFIGNNVGHNGSVYFAPYNTSYVLKLNPDDDTTTTVGSFGGSLRYHIGPPTFDGSFYMAHFYGAGDFAKVIPSGQPIAPKFSYSPWVNNY